MFGCLPSCELSQLTFSDWAWLAAFGVTVYALSRLWGKWAFTRNHHPMNDLRWHIPRFIYVAFVTTMLTVVPIYTFLGDTLGYWYGRLLLAPTIIIAYAAWLFVDVNDPRDQ